MPDYKKTVALDIGEKRIGVAVSDEEGKRAFPFKTLVRQEGWKRDMAALKQLFSEQKAERILVGIPLQMDGTAGIQVEKVEQFIQGLRNYVRIPIITGDERLTTREAERILISAGQDRIQRKENIDSMAACLLLQTLLDKEAGGIQMESIAG